MKAIFVSKNNEEYNRYAPSVNGVEFNDLQVSQGNELASGGGNFSSNELSGDNGDSQMAPIVGKKITIGGTEVVVLDGDKLSSKNNYCYGSVKLCQFLAEILGVVKNTEDARLFVHWGNGGTAENVARIEQKIEQEFRSVSDKRGILSIQSISSMRDDYFKVSTPTQIMPPCTDEGINDLRNKLKQAQEEALPPPYHVGVDIERIEQIKDTSISAVNFKVVVVPMSGSPRLAGNDCNGDGFINSLKHWLKKRLGIDVIGLGNLFADTGNVSQYVIPLFVYDKWNPKAEKTSAKPSYGKWGLMAPKEFLIEYDEGQERRIFGELEDRFKYWAGCEKDLCGADKTRENLRDWLSGTFRKYCFQDEQVHGSGSVMDLHKLDGSQSDINEFIEHWLLESNPSDKASTDKSLLQGRFISKSPKLFDEMEFLAPVLNVVYRSEIEKIGEAIKHIRKTYKTNEEEASLVARIVFRDSTKETGFQQEAGCAPEDDLSKVVGAKSVVLYGDKSPGAVVVAKGSAIRYISPTLKFRVLVVDDKAKEECVRLAGIHASNDIFVFDAMELEGENIVQQAIVKFRELMESRWTFDFALLDLSLGEKPGSDLYGYQLIRLLHQFFPQMPVIVYSQFSDMGHIERAFQCGAKWFLKKGEAEKLPRHLCSMMRRIEWQKEWQVISAGLWEWKSEQLETSRQRAFDARFSDSKEWQYLTYKCLEKYPGKMVVVCPMGDGQSTAATFRAFKGYIRNGHPLQTPVIVKIDNVFNTRLEYERYFRFIRPYIANQSGRIDESERVLNDENAAIVYSFAGGQGDGYELISLKEAIERDIKNRSSCSSESYDRAFDIIFDEILPRIHAVKPSLEFGPEDDVDKALSDFPNRAFGEVNIEEVCSEKDERINSFLANWLYRMPIGRKLENAELIAQGMATEKTNCYEFHRQGIIDGRCVIEALDFKSKCTIVMTGANIDHVVKYRPHTYPCMTLWVDKRADEDIVLEEMIPAMVTQAIEKLHGGDVMDLSAYRAANEFADILKRLMKEPLSAGRPSDGFYKVVLKKEKEFAGKEFLEKWEAAFSRIDDKANTAFNVLPKLLDVAKELLRGSLAIKIMDCPAGIVHGDLNYTNIMLETKKPLSGESAFTNCKLDVKNVWFIDFARTRRDLIAHDFNVLFTSTLGLLFDLDVWRSEETIGHDIYYQSACKIWGERAKVEDTVSYSRFIETIFRTFIVKAVFDELDAVPDGMEHDERISLIFKILRRIRVAALKAGMSKESYAFTTALSCMVAARVYIAREQNNAPAAAAMIATAFICFAQLKRVEAAVGK
ncbi:MAG: hypothetical protein IJH50_04890 [Kiritimatiellae bacterium]|nr:hypothetical protein [Kiritimatiellia bacterium]